MITPGNFNINSELIEKKSYVPIKVKDDDGTETTKLIPVKRQRRNITLTHKTSGDSLVLSAYVHCGIKRFKDSREKSSLPVDSHVVTELMRLLAIPPADARQMLTL